MVSENRIVAYLNAKDKELFDEAVDLYEIGESELLREIVHSWLFSNKLQFKKKVRR